MTRVPKTAIVTGASAGIGRELVRQLVTDRGYTVLATARRRDRLESLASELPDGSVLILDGDLADAGFRARLWEHGESRLPGGVGVLVNNAGLGHYADFATEPIDAWRAILEVNVVALMDLTQRAARHMRARGSGQIVEVSSILGFMGIPYSAAYVASKHAVNGLVTCLRYELRGSGVRVWAACPGQTESEFASVALGQPGGPGHRSAGAPTARIARNILKGLDRNRRFVLPSLQAKVTVALSHWLPGPFDWFMARWGPGYFRRDIEQSGGRVECDLSNTQPPPTV